MDNLPDGLIGTDPKYPSLVDHSWLAVDKNTYDNYPSDNNPVRKQPELAQIWNPTKDAPFAVIPNQTLQPLGIMSAEDQKKANDDSKADIVREAKKAAMTGMDGKEISQHLRSRFSAKHIEAASEELKKVAEEIGLLGNVYIDASAFRTIAEAETFLSQNRNRLARDILVDAAVVNESHMRTLASKFRKNVVASIAYDEGLLSKYKSHLVVSQRLPSDFIIDSKEDLRRAFLYKPAEVKSEPVKVQKKAMEKEEINSGLAKLSEKKQERSAGEQRAMAWDQARPVVTFVQQSLSLKKSASDIKEMLRGRFSMDSIKAAADYIPMLMSKEGLSKSAVDKMVEGGKVSYITGTELLKIAKEYPVKSDIVPETQKKVPWGGVKAFFHSMGGKRSSSDDVYYKATEEALRRGYDISRIRAKLKEKISSEKAGEILESAVRNFNSSPAGVVANRARPSSSKIIIKDTRKSHNLPDPATIPGQLKEITDIFKGANTDIEIDAAFSADEIQIDQSQNSSEIDKML